MMHHPSGKRLEIQPQQFDSLLQLFAEKTPPKTQTQFSTKEIVGRLYEFIERALANHYSFDELVPIIQASLLELEIVEQVPDFKGSTLRQYYLEIQRERGQKRSGKRRSTGNQNDAQVAPLAAVKTIPRPIEEPKSVADPQLTENPMESLTETPVESITKTPDRAPTPRSSNIELAY